MLCAVFISASCAESTLGGCVLSKLRADVHSNVIARGESEGPKASWVGPG